MSVRRVYVEKKPEFAVKAGELREEDVYKRQVPLRSGRDVSLYRYGYKADCPGDGEKYGRQVRTENDREGE